MRSKLPLQRKKIDLLFEAVRRLKGPEPLAIMLLQFTRFQLDNLNDTEKHNRLDLIYRDIEAICSDERWRMEDNAEPDCLSLFDCCVTFSIRTKFIFGAVNSRRRCSPSVRSTGTAAISRTESL